MYVYIQIHIYTHTRTLTHRSANRILSGLEARLTWTAPHDCSASLTTTQTEVCNVPPWNNELRSINKPPLTEYTLVACLYVCVPHCFKSWPNQPRRIWGKVKRCERSTESISALCHNFFRSDLIWPNVASETESNAFQSPSRLKLAEKIKYVLPILQVRFTNPAGSPNSVRNWSRIFTRLYCRLPLFPSSCHQ